MFISDFAIKRPIVTTVVMLALAVFGIFALTLLNTDEFPDVQNPVVVVSVPYPGASPESVEREVIDRIEEGIAEAKAGLGEDWEVVHSRLRRELNLPTSQ